MEKQMSERASDSFAEQIYAIARKIPTGKVASYGQLASMAGRPRAARMVGRFMSRCPEGNGVPCHRVLHKDGSLCEQLTFDLLDIGRQLLRAEGVSFLPDGRVDMAKCRWDGGAE